MPTLKPDSALSPSQLRRRKKKGISVPGTYTLRDDVLQEKTLGDLEKQSPPVDFVEGWTPENRIHSDLQQKVLRKQMRRIQSNDSD